MHLQHLLGPVRVVLEPRNRIYQAPAPFRVSSDRSGQAYIQQNGRKRGGRGRDQLDNRFEGLNFLFYNDGSVRFVRSRLSSLDATIIRADPQPDFYYL